ncbi:Uncharacterized protein Rs2_25854 [Raphanus sativus]|nr:Uncharacterized protein Rs2_25854 [Raphanus sativus]
MYADPLYLKIHKRRREKREKREKVDLGFDSGVRTARERAFRRRSPYFQWGSRGVKTRSSGNQGAVKRIVVCSLRFREAEAYTALWPPVPVPARWKRPQLHRRRSCRWDVRASTAYVAGFRLSFCFLGFAIWFWIGCLRFGGLSGDVLVLSEEISKRDKALRREDRVGRREMVSLEAVRFCSGVTKWRWCSSGDDSRRRWSSLLSSEVLGHISRRV